MCHAGFPLKIRTFADSDILHDLSRETLEFCRVYGAPCLSFYVQEARFGAGCRGLTSTIGFTTGVVRALQGSGFRFGLACRLR